MQLAFSFLLILSSFFSYAQNSVVSDFKENHDTSLSLYFYPSTLRMVNITRDKEFDEMIRDIKKARFFKLDSGKFSREDISNLSKNLSQEGFEEMMFIKNKEMDVRVWGLEKRVPELVILSKSNDEFMLLEIEGMINIAKIPKITETFSQNSFLDVLHLNEQQNK